MSKRSQIPRYTPTVASIASPMKMQWSNRGHTGDHFKIQLSVRTPKHWQIQLTTSSSSPRVTIPAIVLQDASGRIILEAPSRKPVSSKIPTRSQLQKLNNSYVETTVNGRHSKETPMDMNEEPSYWVSRNSTVYCNKEKCINRKNKYFNEVERSTDVNTNNQVNSTVKQSVKKQPLWNHANGHDNKNGGTGRRKRKPISPPQKRFINGNASGDYSHGLTSFPSGPCEESIALIAAARTGHDEACAAYKVHKEHEPRGPRRAVSARRPRPRMGANVSRQSGKGLDGRRSQSSGNLCHGAKLLAPSVGRLFNPCGAGGVSPRDRYKFCGSLPNHLDEKDVRRSGETPESLYSDNNNYGEVYGPSRDVKLVLSKLGPDAPIGDLGYSSERSPEEEVAPPVLTQESVDPLLADFPFITKDNIFKVTVEKGTRGLGLSVAGGVDSDEPHAGLLRIKRLFPHQPAWECGELQPGDILLEADGMPLTGLTNCEALEVLRTTPQSVQLLVCRPPPSQLFAPQSAGEPPPPPRRDPTHAISSSLPLDLSPLPNLAPEPCGEFDITLHKVNGSLGFTLRKEDQSVLGHYVRALVREPALSDGRIKPGDKIVAVNGMDISPLTHEEAVQMLRQCGESVWLRLYRDSAQTPVSALSPTEPLAPTKPTLRQEAVDMLYDLAVRRLSPGESTSPRRRRLERVDPSRASDASKTQRPSFLDLDGESLRRHRFHLVKLDDEPTSLPSISPNVFTPHNPVYQSAHPPHPPCPPPAPLLSDQNGAAKSFTDVGSQGLLKWKGVVFTPEDEVDDAKESTPKTTDSNHSETTEEGEVLTVELSKGWNSRLGFSLQSCESGTWISAIYADSVAAKDGRLRAGDRVLMINDERTDGMTTSEVIDLLRKIRGAIAITVLRPSS